MSYLTTYQLMTMTGVTRDRLVAALPDEDWRPEMKKQLRGYGGIWCKWYEHEAEIAKAMLATGAVQVTLFGIGEDFPVDVWSKIFSREQDGTISVTKVKWGMVSHDPQRRAQSTDPDPD